MEITITYYCQDDSGDNCEVYGRLQFDIGNDPSNQAKMIWNKDQYNYIDVPKGNEYPRIYATWFHESNAFTESTDRISFTGQFFDTANFGPNSDDKLLANMNSFFEAKKVYNKYESQTFPNGGNDYVKITVRFRPF